MEITVRTRQRTYPITIARGALKRAAELIGPCEGGAFILTDSGVPRRWVDELSAKFPRASVHVFNAGERAKNIGTYTEVLEHMAACPIRRGGTLIALGGGVVGDLGGFAAATYMRGIRYVGIPTTLLAQIDSSIGGKTAVNLGGIKNLVGAFHQPSMVIIDPDTLSTLPKRQLANGLAEAIKTAMIGDAALFAAFEGGTWKNDIQGVITACLQYKSSIVGQDEDEQGIRRILNFGHTFGHAFESASGGEYLHGECVAMGMVAILENDEIRRRLEKVLCAVGLPVSCAYEPRRIMELVSADKKASADGVTIVQVDEIGRGELRTVSYGELERILTRRAG